MSSSREKMFFWRSWWTTRDKNKNTKTFRRRASEDWRIKKGIFDAKNRIQQVSPINILLRLRKVEEGGREKNVDFLAKAIKLSVVDDEPAKKLVLAPCEFIFMSPQLLLLLAAARLIHRCVESIKHERVAERSEKFD